jgi:pectin methylesterase-like acyl-CoA thioesterase
MKRLLYCCVITTLLLVSVSSLYGQITNSVLYDFRNGTIIAAGQSSDGKVRLAGTYSLHGAQYGMNMKVNGTITIDVAGSCTIRFLGSQYSGLKMEGKADVRADLGVQDTKVVNDVVDVYDFTYSGKAKTLTFTLVAGTGNDLYLPQIEVIPSQKGNAVTTPAKNIIYYFDLRDGSIIPTTTNGQSNINMGLISVIVGPSNAYGYNGTQHGSVLKTGNQIKLAVNGNATIRIGGSQFSNGTISVSSTTGTFNKSSQQSQTVGNYGNDGVTVDFIYVGTAGTVTLDFTATNYIPYIEVVPIPYPFTLSQWVVKSGTITLDSVKINLTSGADVNSNATVTLNKGVVNSASPTVAFIQVNLAGKNLSAIRPVVTGDIDSVRLVADSIYVVYKNPTATPKTYLFKVIDQSKQLDADFGKTYMYNFADGSEMPQTSYQALRYPNYVTKDGILTIQSNTAVAAKQFGYHDAAHGGVMFPGNSFKFKVTGDAIVTFFVDTYGSAADAIFEYADSLGNVLATTKAVNLGGVDGFPINFAYTGNRGFITATIKSVNFPTAEIYLHGVNIEMAPKKNIGNGKIDAWDFGAVQLDTAKYNNKLNVTNINAWYPPSVIVGSSGNVLPASWNEGALTWTGGTNDRLRTTNTALTRFDENVANATGYTGRLYVNGQAATTRFFSLQLNEDDKVTLATTSDATGLLNFTYVADPAAQTDTASLTTNLNVLDFVAKKTGAYRIFDNSGKPSYFRILRQDAKYITLSGKINKTQATGLPVGYKVVFTNTAGKVWKATSADTTFSIRLPSGYTYSLSLEGANEYVISAGKTLQVADTSKTHLVTIKKVELYTVQGTIAGLGTTIGKLSLKYTTTNAAAVYVPVPVVDSAGAKYTVSLEPNIAYTIQANGVNDYNIQTNTITIAAATTTANMNFVAKPTYKVTITAQGLTTVQNNKLALSFTNLVESGYTYSFANTANIKLRNGTYRMSVAGLDSFPVELALTSNLVVKDADTAKVLAFKPVTRWSFEDRVIGNRDTTYKGMLFKGTISNEIAKGHLVAKPGAVIKVPVNKNDRIIVEYYYTAGFSFNGLQPTRTNTQSTSILEKVRYDYLGDTSGYVSILVDSSAATTYITDIQTVNLLPYLATLRVGATRDYKNNNEALAAVRRMKRPNDERVTILIDPDNYEEMLAIDVNNVTLKNAAAAPSIALKNGGVDIDPNAVRITSYYGYGYNYYSQSNQVWNADALRVNKENGSISYENQSGTTNNSYWNATVVVYGSGFVAEDIIFENAYNQYISKKESEDVVVEWAVGGKGTRPKAKGSTAVQNRSFVERACALAIANGTDKAIIYKCRVIGRQDALFGGVNSRFVMYKGAAMGAVDYIFGGMTAVFYKTGLSMNTSDVAGDQAYITAPQQSTGRGYLMYECIVTSATPGTETVSATRSKPGYFGRPWQATTSEVVFYNTAIETSNYPGSENKSLIVPLGWQNTLGGESSKMYEYGTFEKSGENNASARATWATKLTAPTLTDGTAITTLNFTKGTDGWDPIPALIAQDPNTGVYNPQPQSSVQVWANGNTIFVSNVKGKTTVSVYNTIGQLFKSVQTSADTSFLAPSEGIWLVSVTAPDGSVSNKVFTRK